MFGIALRRRRPDWAPHRSVRCPWSEFRHPPSEVFNGPYDIQEADQEVGEPHEHTPQRRGDSSAGRGGRTGNRLSDDEPRHEDFRRPEQSSARSPGTHAAGGFRPSRENFPLRPRANSRAHRARPRFRSARLLRVHACHSRPHACHRVREEGEAHSGVLPVFHRGGLQGLQRHSPGCPRLRGQVLFGRRQLGPRWKQYARVLHSGRDEVPRSCPCGQAGGGPRFSAGGLCARHVLGLRVADAREHAHDHVGDVGSRAPAVAADDGRLRRAHLSLRQRRR